MRIEFHSSGGYMNLSLNYVIDSEVLPHDLADELQKLVDQANFFNIQQTTLGSHTGGPPDVLSYRLSISSPIHNRTIECNDVTAPKALLPLLGRLQELALQEQSKSL